MNAPYCARMASMALALALYASGAAGCNFFDAPKFATVIASPLDEVNVAWVIMPDCTYSEEKISSPIYDDSKLTILGKNIERVESLPTGTIMLSIEGRLTGGINFSGLNLERVSLSGFAAGLINELKFPSSMKELFLTLGSGSVTSVDNLILPDTLEMLHYTSMGISSIKSLPRSLTYLALNGDAFTSINFPIPPRMQTLRMDNNPFSKLEGTTFPDTMKSFSCADCKIASIKGVRWPSKLKTLNLESNPIGEFELRQSDFAVLSALSDIKLSTSLQSCSDDQAEDKVIKGFKVCVITDDQFEDKYSGNGASKTPSPGSGDKGSGSTSPSGDDSSTSDKSDNSNNNGTSSGQDPNDSGGSSLGSNGQPSNGRTRSPGVSGVDTEGSTNEDQSTSSMSPTVTAIFIAVSCVFGILLAVVGFRLYVASRRNREKEDVDTIVMPFDTPIASSQDASSSNGGGTSHEYLSNDIRNDKAIIPYRIDQTEISLSKQIARSRFAIVYRATCNGRAVAVKQMLPDAWRNESQLISFMDEIRLCVSLSHPKIVEFIGVAWTSLRDISVVSEFMAGGDLSAVLRKHAHAQSSPSSTTSFASDAAAPPSSFIPSPREWSERWTAASINSKTSIARDIAEAVVYLHSFSDPIVHRDLKARNVLLDTRGNAKLSDFGISRKLAVDETMTSEVGTSAWIAPEVLRGDRYSEQADMYSFGVLLVELDKCRHPYAGEETLELMGLGGRQQHRRDGDSQEFNHQNMQIAMLVSAGRLRPWPSSTCPARVQVLIARCLSFAPEDRPSAMEAHYELRQILADL